MSHPTLEVTMSVAEQDYAVLGFRCPKVESRRIRVVADSGAQSCLWSRAEFQKSGFSQGELIPVRHMMKSANRTPITIDGAIILRLIGYSADGHHVEAAVIVYISPEAHSFYLSREAMVQLGIIPKTFPQIGAVAVMGESAKNCTNVDAVDATKPLLAECGCLLRSNPPDRPKDLPFDCNNENIDRMKQWLLDHYAGSTFNQCPHQVLPDMEGPPMQLHVDQNAKLVNFTTPASVPLHWKEKVKQDLDRDVALGVIEKVPYGEPTTVCHRMIITRKHNGEPRRTVDMSPTNKHCQRETYPSESPFHLARSVPPRTFKTVLDAWNGFHSIPVREEDRYLMTFITEWGLYRALRAIQGFISSGDGYNRRFDEITKHFVRLLRCIDDSLIHDVTLEEHWWRVIEFLEIVGKAGIVLNPEKFQFSQETVDFAGFRITKDSVEPLPKYIDAIREYPTPTNISDIRSWFGLVNQVSHYSQLRDMMAPFRKFLSPKVKFEWSEELDTLFKESKRRIVESIYEGVKIFDTSKKTCLSTDYSKIGIGFWLLQKHCACTSESTTCCTNGWKITLASSRFLSSAERNYVALAVAWGLEQTRYFTLGCNDLLVLTDHKPLVKIFGDRRLEEINNPRLFRMKQRTLMWRFTIQYRPGKANATSDALSRYPHRYAETAGMTDNTEESIIAAVAHELENFFAITLERVGEISKTDESISALKAYLLHGFPASKKAMPKCIADYWEFRDGLTIWDDVLLYNDRVIIPTSLREHILHNVHSAHQGVTGMTARAEATFFWPGISADLSTRRECCRQCHLNAPSQPKIPPITNSDVPKVPFEKIFGDYFQLQGKHYLIIGDRLSGYPEVLQVKPGTCSSGAKGLITALRRVFATFGVPKEISSDGGPEFVANETMNFYLRWGTKHRLSSSHFPQSNGRAEVAVKSTKRLLECNIGPDGSLDTDEVVRALLQLRNTPDRDCKLSPAQILFGRPLRDSMPYMNKSTSIFDNKDILCQWHKLWKAKEDAIRSRSIRTFEKLSEHSRPLPPLMEGDSVFIQNQSLNSPKSNKWDRQGVVVVKRNYDQYLIRTSGTGRLTLRNRRFLKKFDARTPFLNVTHQTPVVPINKEPIAQVPRTEYISPAAPTYTVEPPHDAPHDAQYDDPHDAPHDDPHDAGAPSSDAQDPTVRRSTRTPQLRKHYDATSGLYTDANV